jgi:transposase-like protein
MKHGVNANQVFKWKRLYEAGRLGRGAESAVQLLPVRVAEEREVARQPEPVAAAVPSSGTTTRPELARRVEDRLEECLTLYAPTEASTVQIAER